MPENLATKKLNYNLSSEQLKIITQVKGWSESFFDQVTAEDRLVMGSHGFDHNQRVMGMAARLAVLERFDKGLFPAVITSLVFDVGRNKANDDRAHGPEHGLVSRELTVDFLKDLQAFSSWELERMGNAIEDHPKLNPQVRTESGYPLVQILMDADRLDTIGALAPIRAAATRWRLPIYTSEIDTNPEDRKIKTIYQDIVSRLPRWYYSIWTDSARAIARRRQAFLLRYIRQLDSEVKPMMADYQTITSVSARSEI